MPHSEFDLIDTILSCQKVKRADIVLGAGDDCAILTVPPDCHLLVSMDTLNSGVHFPQDSSAKSIGHKALAVNLSDLAAMGAKPAWFTLALSLPEIKATWVHDFCSGLFALADQHDIALVGGDVTRGALSITIQIHGLMAKNEAVLKRSNAQVNDDIYISGQLGEAGLGLRFLQNTIAINSENEQYAKHCIQQLNYPQPQVQLGQSLTKMAHAAIDISDGLAADLQHMLDASQLGADVSLQQLPITQEMRVLFNQIGGYEFPLSCGDDYQLCFTAAPENETQIIQLSQLENIRISKIGKISQHRGLRFIDENKQIKSLTELGFDHFKN